MKTLRGIYKQQENQNMEKNGEKQQYGKKQSKSVNTENDSKMSILFNMLVRILEDRHSRQ